MADGSGSLAVQERQRLSGGGLDGPDRDNLAVILSLATFVRDSLGGAPADVVERRLSNLRSATDAAIDLGALPELVRPTFDELVQRVQATAESRQDGVSATFAAAVLSMDQDARDLPDDPEAGSHAGAGDRSMDDRSMMERLWGVMSARTAK